MTSFYDTTSIRIYMDDRRRELLRDAGAYGTSEVTWISGRTVQRQPIRQAVGFGLIRAGAWVSGTAVNAPSHVR